MPPSKDDYKRVKHVHEVGDFHEFTFSCYHQKNLLADPNACLFLARSIDRAGERYNFRLMAFVFMPNHVHLLTHTVETNPDFPAYLSAIKQPVSLRMKRYYERERPALLRELTIRERPNKMTFRFWQEGPGYDRNLNQAEAILGSIHYLHLNPVRKNLCEKTVDWKWTSARFFENPLSPSDASLPKVYPLPFEVFE